MSSAVLVQFALVVAGGMMGTAARIAVSAVTGAAEPMLGTLIVNVLGAFLIGVLAARVPASRNLRVFLGTGVLGGFTTYSAFAVSTVMAAPIVPITAVAFVIGTLVLGFAAAALGLRLGRRSAEATA